MVELTLTPTDSRKSFYGKAVVRKEGNVLTLQSYYTDVCTYNTETGEFVRLWDGYSATTMRHVKAFLATFCDRIQGGGKAWWEGLEVA